MQEDIRDEMRQKIRQAFAWLRRNGWVARMNFSCCQGCGWPELPSPEEKPNAVFFHRQDNDDLNSREPYVYLAWRGDAAQLLMALSSHGLAVEWDGSDSTRFKVVGVAR